MAVCDKTKDVFNGSCSGIGCSKIQIPEGVLDYGIYVQAGFFNNYSMANDSRPCGYALVVEEGAYNFSLSDVVMSSKKRQRFPVVLGWAIPGNLTCKQANMMKNHSYACLANNSECLNTTNPPGYRCKCGDGFQGNPYLPDGCQDIDECKSTPNPCNITSTCINLPGTFNCSCSKGYEGDGLKNGTGCFPVDGLKDNSTERLYIALGFEEKYVYWQSVGQNGPKNKQN